MNNIEYLTKEASIIVNLYNSKRYSEAITKSKKAIKRFPDQILFYNILSLSLSATNKNDEAINILTGKIIELKRFHGFRAVIKNPTKM